MKHIMALAIIASLSVAPAFAADAPDGPKVGGDVKINQMTNENIAGGIGNESKASQEIGNVNSGDIKGNVNIGGQATGNIAGAIGNKSCASQKIGSVGGKGAHCE